MPGKLKVLVGVMVLNLLITGAQLALESKGMTAVALAINGFILYGVLKGNESIRRALIALSWLGLILNAIALVLLVPAITVVLGTLTGIVTFLAVSVGSVRSALTIWVLSAPEVQTWMYKRSMGLKDEP